MLFLRFMKPRGEHGGDIPAGDTNMVKYGDIIDIKENSNLGYYVFVRGDVTCI